MKKLKIFILIGIMIAGAILLTGCTTEKTDTQKDITLEQLLKQCDKIEPDWCACGIKSINKYNEGLTEEYQNPKAEIIIDYNSIKKANEDVSCKLKEE